MSLLGAAVGSGFVVGPAVGGVMAKKVGLGAPPLLSAALFAIALCVVTFGLPESVCHTWLEPRTSRPHTGLLLTRVSLASDRPRGRSPR